jgi:hypothetical protein
VTRRTVVSLALFFALALPAAAHAEFGFAPGKASATWLNSKGTLERQAGAHPFSFTIHFELNTDEKGFTEGGPARDFLFDVPPGFVGNPQAIPTCPRHSFEGGVPQCKPGTQVGVLRAIVPGIGEALGPIYNLAPFPGTPVQFGFESNGLQSLQSASVLTEEGYGIRISAPNLPLEVTEVTATIWGTPADSLHTPERGPVTPGNVPSEAPLLPFLTLPTSCDSPPVLTISADSAFNPDVFVREEVPLVEAGKPVALKGCEAVPFKPTVRSAPTTQAAGSASGLGFELKLPDEGLLNPAGGAISETQPVKTEVTLPAGVTANSAAAGGLAACSLAQYKAATLTNPGCPEASKVGTLLANTPLLDEPIEGSVYLAAPKDNPFNSFLALYIVASAPERGIFIKQAGEVRADPVTGQLTTIVDGLPPVPYSSFEVKLREGPRAPLITPRTCGTYTTTARLYPFSAPDTPVERTAPFAITSGAGGTACASSESQLPNRPTLDAGTTVPLAAAYAPFLFKVSRQDGSQLFSSLRATPPPGLLGKLAGVPYCPEAQIAAAQARSFEGAGALEAIAPSCPAASQVGIVNAGAGAGSSPYYVQGKIYLAGPYEGAPLSLVIITPAIAGPFDLGVVTIRAAIQVNESTGQITVQSDPLPTILQGIPLDIRSAAVQVNRENFALNPTNCEPLAVSGALTSTLGSVAALSAPFQVGGCRNLPFTPKLQMSLSGATTRAKHPAFKAVLTQPQGQANLKRFSLTLPPTEFVDPNHVANPCTRPQFAEHKCPSSSVLGKVRAFTPLLDKPLEGPIYFRANGGERELPDAVADLNGQVHLVSVGFVDALHHKGSEESRIRTTIATVPDAPISKVIIELKGGKKHGLLVNSANICKSANRALVKMWGQNGKVQSSEPKIAVECGGKSAGRKKRR